MPSSKQHHHRGIIERHLREGYQNIFKPEQFSASHLVRHVITFSKLRGSDMTRLQAKALHKYYNERIYDISRDSKYSDENIFSAYADLFDDIFFFGSLKGSCTFYPGEESKLPETSFKQETSKKRPAIKFHGIRPTVYIKHEKKCDVWLYPPPSIRGASRSEKLLVKLGILLHAMAHAFLVVYACYQASCSGVDGDNRLIYSHGKAWQDIAFAIEEAVKDRHISLDLRLGRMRNLALELKRTKKGIPPAEDLLKWRMDLKALEREMEIQISDPAYAKLSRRACI